MKPQASERTTTLSPACGSGATGHTRVCVSSRDQAQTVSQWWGDRKHMSPSPTLGPVTGTLFGKRGLTDGLKSGISRRDAPE